jgi:hypothetical protein
MVKRTKYATCVHRKKHNETHQTLFEKRGRKKGRDENIMEGVNLFKVHCRHA